MQIQLLCPLLPSLAWVPWSRGRPLPGEGKEGSCCREATALQRPLGHHLGLFKLTRVQLGVLFVRIRLRLPHTTVYTSQAAIKARKGCERKDPLTPPKCCVEASDKSEKHGSGYLWPSWWYNSAETHGEGNNEVMVPPAPSSHFGSS